VFGSEEKKKKDFSDSFCSFKVIDKLIDFIF
jgi:hypothetical protein